MRYKVVKYNDANKALWNDFLALSKNSTFLFHRDFMEYHKDRFTDASLMVYENDTLLALLPANKAHNVVYSHQGLTYGGLLLNQNIKFRSTIKLFKALLEYLAKCGTERLELKILPHIYTKQPSEELAYLMFVMNAKLYRRDALSVLNLNSIPKFSKDRIEGNKRGLKNKLVIKEVDSFDEFWNKILNINLQNKYQVKPVHTLEEITFLKRKFPKNIRQFNVYKNDEIVAGTTIFETENVAHSQYISGNNDKNSIGSLDFLHINLIENIFKNKAYFDFGISNEDNGRKVNEGLQYWKEGFGARTITQDFYSINTRDYKLLDDVML